MNQVRQRFELVPAFRISRKLKKESQASFEPIKGLQNMAADMGARAVSNAGMVSVDIIKPSDAVDLDRLGVKNEDAQAKMAELTQSNRSKLKKGLWVELEQRVEPREDGLDIRLVIPTTGQSSYQLRSEQERLHKELYGYELASHMDLEEIPGLTIAIVGDGYEMSKEKAAGILAIVAEDMLWAGNPDEPVGSRVNLYPLEHRDATAKKIV